MIVIKNTTNINIILGTNGEDVILHALGLMDSGNSTPEQLKDAFNIENNIKATK